MMSLKVTLRPNEQMIVNGCSIRNTGRTHELHIESRADLPSPQQATRSLKASPVITSLRIRFNGLEHTGNV